MLLRIDPTSPTPLFDQLAQAIRGGLAAGEIAPGDRLPAARELAASLGINMHTVLRSYAALRDDGVIHLRRGRGAVVVDAPPGRLEIREAAAQLLAAGRRNGLSLNQIHEALDEGANS
ncbi:GntR family transcriptional regulator [Nostocoides jenkinsii]|uniref:Regulatory protein GntR HTH n=1 Tax=Nostocoides jenkinsii Ben 74 TaxID=1193518 RepID=A0A077M8M7_9MICO|nr:GntR family transcriptional regulator [Tetrasphaera jenkinsii]CCI52230.1 Regulatory protein GntR HTH [Tetrasphaera jenkinsii Ben 74]